MHEVIFWGMILAFLLDWITVKRMKIEVKDLWQCLAVLVTASSVRVLALVHVYPY